MIGRLGLLAFFLVVLLTLLHAIFFVLGFFALSLAIVFFFVAGSASAAMSIGGGIDRKSAQSKSTGQGG